MVITKGKF